MKNEIQAALAQSYTYESYRAEVKSQLEKGKVTGHEQSEALLHYTELNEARMNRLEKTTNLTAETQHAIQQWGKKIVWLVLTEGWCGDGAQVLPVLYKIAQENANIDFKLVFRDQNEELMQLVLTNDSRAIPKLLIIDAESHTLLGQWGPRPQGALELIANYKKEHGVVDETAKANLHLWYFHDKGVEIQQEIVALMHQVLSTSLQNQE
ncbi:MAG: thioredoxin family protein [Flavobacterium sp.]|nr:thioredoxin family protein [Flavobacterium sp.]